MFNEEMAEDFEKYDYHEYNAKVHWEMNYSRMKRWIEKYKKGTFEQRCWIIDMLHDMNFHHEASMLAWGKYDELLEEATRW